METRLLQDENHVLFMTKCLGKDHCDISKLVHNSQEEYATFYKIFSKGVIPDRKLKNMIRSYNAFPFELNFTVHDEALLMITNKYHHYVRHVPVSVKLHLTKKLR